MADSILTLDGVRVDSAPVFMPDCNFPVTDWANCCYRDDFVNNFPIHVGHWSKNTKAPAIIGKKFKVKTPAASTDDCELSIATVSTEMESCELVAPNMVDLALKTPDIKLTDLEEEFCRRRNILRGQLCVFNADGSLNPGNPWTFDFVKFAMTSVYSTLINELMRVAVEGDSANANPIFSPNEFDGFFTQLMGGWDQGSATPCPDTFNKATIIDWAALTGTTGCASPDSRTIAGQSITIYGKTYQVPEGYNLAQFIDELWIPRIEKEANCVGGVTAWDMIVSEGFPTCFLKSTACMQPCNTCANFFSDPNLRDKYAMAQTSKVAEFLSGRRLPMMESSYVNDGDIWLGPRSVGGRPTYGLFVDDMDRFFGNYRYANGDGYGQYDGTYDPFGIMPANELRNNLEDRSVYWTLQRRGICVRGIMMMRAGVLTCSRNLFVKFTNVCCPSMINKCDTPQIEIVA